VHCIVGLLVDVLIIARVNNFVQKTSTRQALNNAREVLQTAIENRDEWKSKH
jgi:hypothetical protein